MRTTTALPATDPKRGLVQATRWNCESSVPYEGGPYDWAIFQVNCTEFPFDTFMAIGATFEGGTGGDVPSALVGRATQIECDPNIADPDDNLYQRPKFRPR